MKVIININVTGGIDMNTDHTKIADQMLDNFTTLKSPFKWQHDVTRWLVALAYATSDKRLDVDEIKDVMQYIKKNTGMFSPFKGETLFPISSLLTINSEQPQQEFKSMKDNYDVMKSVGFKQTTHFPIALYTLNMAYKGNDPEGYLEQTMEIYKEMRSNHPFLTGGDDYALAILLTNEQGKLDKIEENYKALKDSGFSVSNGLQMMSHILTLSDEPTKVLVSRCQEIMDQLKTNKLKVYSDYYSAIAITALIGSNTYTDDLIELAKYIKGQKQAKWLSKGLVVMLASAIVSYAATEETDQNQIMATLSVSIQAVVAAQQAAMIAAVGAASAGAAASS